MDRNITYTVCHNKTTSKNWTDLSRKQIKLKCADKSIHGFFIHYKRSKLMNKVLQTCE